MKPQDVKEILENYFSAVDSQKSATPTDLTEAMNALEKISQHPPEGLPGRLKHYLESRSYRKAYAELGGIRS